MLSVPPFCLNVTVTATLFPTPRSPLLSYPTAERLEGYVGRLLGGPPAEAHDQAQRAGWRCFSGQGEGHLQGKWNYSVKVDQTTLDSSCASQ